MLRCLLDLHQLMAESEQMYILNDLYITDYCVWLQQVKYVSTFYAVVLQSHLCWQLTNSLFCVHLLRSKHLKKLTEELLKVGKCYYVQDTMSL